MSNRWKRQIVIIGGAASLAAAILAGPAAACGGLVGENGTIRLTRTATVAAYHRGVERYVTSFQFSGEGKEVGSIIPLPDVPSKVERGGDWTLQRLQREVNPPPALRAAELAGAADASKAEVLLETKIDALDITILRGGSHAVGAWALDHGFLLTPNAPEVLDFYASRSPIFMAARFDASRAKALGQTGGDGTPIMLTIPTDAPWVPLRILALGLERARPVDADVFLLTDERPKLLAGGSGLSLAHDAPASSSLLRDLRTDKGMGWVPSKMWFTYLRLQAPAGTVDYDLAVSTRKGALPKLVDAGVTAKRATPIAPVPASSLPLVPLAAGVAAGRGAFAVTGRRRRPGRTKVAP